MRCRSLTSPGPIFDSLFIEPSFFIMLCEEFGLGLYQLRRLGFERFGDLRMQLLPSTAQQAAVRRVLYQRVLEAEDRLGWRATLEHQLGGDEVSESRLQLFVGKARDGTQQSVGKLTPNRRADLRHPPIPC